MIKSPSSYFQFLYLFLKQLNLSLTISKIGKRLFHSSALWILSFKTKDQLQPLSTILPNITWPTLNNQHFLSKSLIKILREITLSQEAKKIYLGLLKIINSNLPNSHNLLSHPSYHSHPIIYSRNLHTYPYFLLLNNNSYHLLSHHQHNSNSNNSNNCSSNSNNSYSHKCKNSKSQIHLILDCIQDLEIHINSHNYPQCHILVSRCWVLNCHHICLTNTNSKQGHNSQISNLSKDTIIKTLDKDLTILKDSKVSTRITKSPSSIMNILRL